MCRLTKHCYAPTSFARQNPMGLKQRLEAEAAVRSEQLASRFPSARCISCGTAGVGELQPTEFHWRKQVGRSAEHHVRIEHASSHLLCDSCLDELRRRRRWFWPIRYAGGIGLAAALCGVVTVPVLLYCMRLSTSERREIISIGLVAAILLPVAIIALAVARRYSVPASLLDMTGRGWECISLRPGNRGPTGA
jgi:hypothetical protein